ncbi:two-component response regulator 24-like [Mercurialis annua]|uniref:two-component response regulator 24-like n=1 Tax=Mercurialis annua TaxID=3986 RepID=UPI00215F9929|nr:two-component response regulator 24-like [Mercurialis annua]
MESEKSTFSSESSNVADDKKISKNKPFSVLIVDDDVVSRTIHKMLLEMLEMEVYVAVTGEEAVEFHVVGASFDLILMDFHLPIMNGYQATRELRDMGIYRAIVGVTSCTEAERRLFMESGLDDCIFKPLTIDKIASYLPVPVRFRSNNTSCGEDDDVGSSSYNYAVLKDDELNYSSSSSNTIF